MPKKMSEKEKIMTLLNSVIPTGKSSRPRYFSTQVGLRSQDSERVAMMDIDIADWCLPINAELTYVTLEALLDSKSPNVAFSGKHAKLYLLEDKRELNIDVLEKIPSVNANYEIPLFYIPDKNRLINKIKKGIEKEEEHITFVHTSGLHVSAYNRPDGTWPLDYKSIESAKFNMKYAARLIDSLKLADSELRISMGKDLPLKVEFSAGFKYGCTYWLAPIT